MHAPDSPDCPFCHPAVGRVRLETPHAVAVLDGFPVTPGHTLVVPRRHVASLFDLSEAEQAAVFLPAQTTKPFRLAPVQGWCRTGR